MLTCQEIVRSTTDFLEHKLRIRQRIAFLAHLASCRACRTYLAQIRVSIRGLRSLTRHRSGDPPVEPLLDEFRNEIERNHH